jgi:hypothetical protein
MFTGRVFNFQGYGEYVLAKIGGLEVQVRQRTCSTGVTCNFGVCSPSFLCAFVLLFPRYLLKREVPSLLFSLRTTLLPPTQMAHYPRPLPLSPPTPFPMVLFPTSTHSLFPLPQLTCAPTRHVLI